MKRLVLAAFLVCALALSACNGDGGDVTPETTFPPPFEVAPGVLATIGEAPPLPSGAQPLSDFVSFESNEESALVVGLPLLEPQESTLGLGFFTYEDGAWKGTIGAIQLVEVGTVLEGQFPSVPANVMVLKFDEGEPSPGA